MVKKNVLGLQLIEVGPGDRTPGAERTEVWLNCAVGDKLTAQGGADEQAVFHHECFFEGLLVKPLSQNFSGAYHFAP